MRTSSASFVNIREAHNVGFFPHATHAISIMLGRPGSAHTQTHKHTHTHTAAQGGAGRLKKKMAKFRWQTARMQRRVIDSRRPAASRRTWQTSPASPTWRGEGPRLLMVRLERRGQALGSYKSSSFFVPSIQAPTATLETSTK